MPFSLSSGFACGRDSRNPLEARGSPFALLSVPGKIRGHGVSSTTLVLPAAVKLLKL
jgi:hypothetical protein